MGKVRFKGDVSTKEFQILEGASGEVDIKNATDGVNLAKFESGATWKIPVPIPDCDSFSGAADAVATILDSVYKFRIPKPLNLKDVVVRASWSASNSDSVTEIDLIDDTSGNIVCSVSGNTGTDTESTDYTAGNLTDNGTVHVRIRVTTASGTAGATTTISYVIVEIKVGLA